MKTAEEILSKHTGQHGIYLTKGEVRGSDALEAMEEYGKQKYNQGVRDAAENVELNLHGVIDKNSILKLIVE